MKKYTAACGICVALLAGWTGRADAATCRVALMQFRGPAASEMQDIVVASLPGKCLAVPGGAGGRGSYADNAKRLGVGAIVEGAVTRDRQWHLRLWVRTNGDNGELQRAVWGGKRIRDLMIAVQRGAPMAMRAMLRGAAGFAPPASSPAVVTAPTSDSPATESESSSGGGSSGGKSSSASAAAEKGDAEVSASASPSKRSLFEISVGPRVISRTFTYVDNLSGLPGYTLGSALAAFGEAELYPTAFSGRFDLGVAASFESSVGAKTAQNGAQRDTRMRAWSAGARLRAPAGIFLFCFGADYGQHEFAIDVDADTVVPNVRYTFVRPQLGIRIEGVGNFSLGLTAGYLNVLAVAGMNNPARFPRITAIGAEVEASLGYAIDEKLEVRLVADIRHYAQAMHVRQGDPYIAGGALDEHFGGSLLISYRLR